MLNKCYLWFVFFLALVHQDTLFSQTSVSVPTPYIYSVNVITGQTSEEGNESVKYEFYVQGKNNVLGEFIELAKKDDRIGKVKAVIDRSIPSREKKVYFSYSQGKTDVIDNPERKSVYYFSKNELIEAVEHYEKCGEEYSMYRRERLFWENHHLYPLLVSRILEDAVGQALLCYAFEYNDKGWIVKESLFGDLSGENDIPLLISKDGKPKQNGVECYQTIYQYGDNGSLIEKIDGNGLSTFYAYHPTTKQLYAKFVGRRNHFLSRCFYEYDSLGFLNKTILDDGKSSDINDLEGVTSRQIMIIQSSHDSGPTFAQPLVIENRYANLETGEESLINKEVNEYNAQGLVIKKQFYNAHDEFVYDVLMTYDDKGELVSTTDNRGQHAEIPQTLFKEKFNDLNQRIASIDANGNETNYEYDSFGRVVKLQYPQVCNEDGIAYAPYSTLKYNALDQVIEEVNRDCETIKKKFTVRGHPSELLFSDGSKEVTLYDRDGAIKEKVARNGQRTLYHRDSFRRISKIEEFSQKGVMLRSYSFTHQGSRVISMQDNAGTTVDYEYDSAGREKGFTQVTPSGIKRIEWGYNAMGQRDVTKQWFGEGAQDYNIKREDRGQNSDLISTSIEDAEGRIQRYHRYTDQEKKEENFFSQDLIAQNELGQFVRLEETIDRSGTRSLKTYDALHRVVNEANLNSLGKKISEKTIRYNQQGKKAREEHSVIAGGVVLRTYILQWDYDFAGRLAGIHEGVGSYEQKSTRYQYNDQGLVVSITKPNGVQISHEYDEKGQMVQVSASDDSLKYSFEYDSKGRVRSIRDEIQGMTQRRDYNDFNELVREDLGVGSFVINNQYDRSGRRTLLQLPDSSKISYLYQGSLLASVTRLDPQENLKYVHQYRYEIPSGRLVESLMINDLGSINYEYHKDGHLMAIKSPWWSEESSTDDFDPYGRIYSHRFKDPKGESEQRYVYSDDQQIEREEGESTTQFVHDSLFNTLRSGDEEWVVNSLNQLEKTPNAVFEYNRNGGRIKKTEGNSEYTYRYDAMDRLIFVSKEREFTLEYVYDFFNRRIKEVVTQWDSHSGAWGSPITSYYLYDGQNEIGKGDEKGQLKELRILGLGKGAEIAAAVALEINGKVLAPLHDHQGSVRCLVDAELGSVVEFYRYSVTGKEHIFSSETQEIHCSAVGNSWRFFSKRMDQESQLSFFGLRYYDAMIARWISPDPLFFQDTPNLYAFVKNDAVNHFDLYGLFSWSSLLQNVKEGVMNSFHYLQTKLYNMKSEMNGELRLPDEYQKALEKTGKHVLGIFYLLMGFGDSSVQHGSYGQHEHHNKVRVTFINGILTGHDQMMLNLDLISQTHGGVNVHYLFHASPGWTRDVVKALFAKVGYYFGYRSGETHMLADMWRSLIQDMGGTGSGGMIVHYAHSLGGTFTDRARDLLSPEEQKMIKVVTFGSATMVRNQGFQNVSNFCSYHDFIQYFDPFGLTRNLFDPMSNVQYLGGLFHGSEWSFFDHSISGATFSPMLKDLGDQFLSTLALG